MLRVATIGVYGWTLEQFLEVLSRARVSCLLDVRQRRGVRGPEYSWANSQRLQRALAEAGIRYEHHIELAPTTELRHLQYADDDRQRVGKRSRVALAPEYAERYRVEILGPVDLEPLVSSLPSEGATAIFCVERDPEACHRSILAARIGFEFDATVEHLLPPVE